MSTPHRVFPSLAFALVIAGPMLSAGVAATQEAPVSVPARGQDPPPIPLEFYGYTKDAAPRRAFLREGKTIFIAPEGDLIKDRYRLVRIDEAAAIVEDTSNGYREKLPLAARGPSDDSALMQEMRSLARSGKPGNASVAVPDNAPVAVKTGAPPQASAEPVSVDRPDAPVRRHRRRRRPLENNGGASIQDNADAGMKQERADN